jgi:hypothetical protein
MIRPEDPQFLDLAKSVLMTHQRGGFLDNTGSGIELEWCDDDNDASAAVLGTPEEIAQAVDTAMGRLYVEWDVDWDHEPTQPGITLEII